MRGAANFRFFADKAPEARNGLALHQDAHTNYTIPDPHRAGGCDHALEHPLYARHLENRTGPGGGLYGGAQARGIEPADCDDPR